MWSLPDISAMNSQARTTKARILRAVKTGRINRSPIACEHCDKPAVTIEAYYDIFSEDPKGIASFCEEHESWKEESYFQCDMCQRLMVRNYTWELYVHVDQESGAQYCLPCYCKRELAVEENWIGLAPRVIDSLTFDVVRKAKHLIGVRMPVPKSIEYQRNVEFDSMSGGRLTGSSSCESSPDGGVEELKGYLHELREAGHTRAILIIDGAYQFSVSVGIYTPAKKNRRAA